MTGVELAIKYLENKDFINYSCIISNITDKIKLLENLIEDGE